MLNQELNIPPVRYIDQYNPNVLERWKNQYFLMRRNNTLKTSSFHPMKNVANS